jgi:hypothetical protein
MSIKPSSIARPSKIYPICYFGLKINHLAALEQNVRPQTSFLFAELSSAYSALVNPPPPPKKANIIISFF